MISPASDGSPRRPFGQVARRVAEGARLEEQSRTRPPEEYVPTKVVEPPAWPVETVPWWKRLTSVRALVVIGLAVVAVIFLVATGGLGLGLYSLLALVRFFQHPATAAQALAGAVRQFQTTLINVGHSCTAAGEVVVVVAGLLAFILLRWSRRRKP